MKNIKHKQIFALAAAAAAVYLFTVYWSAAADLISLFFKAITPLICGCAIAYIINLPLGAFEKLWKKSGKKIDILRRPFCLVFSFITVALILFLLFSMILPELQSCIVLLIKEVPPFINEAYSALKNALNLSPEIASELEPLIKNINWENAVKQAIDIITTGMGSALNAVFSFVLSVFSVIITLFVAIVFAVYLLHSKEKLGLQVKTLITSYTKPKLHEGLFNVLKTLNFSFKKFIVGQCTEAVILGALCFLGMLIFRLPYASMIAVLVGFTALIPVAGAYIGAAVGAFMIFTVSPVKALVFLIFLIVLQQFEGNVIYPRVVGKSIGLPGIWVLAAITIGGGVLGIPGMLLAVPLASTAYILLKSNISNRKAEHEAV